MTDSQIDSHHALVPSPAAESRLHPLGRLAHHFGLDIRVGVDGEADLRMAQKLHDGSRVHALRQQQRRGAMAQIVEAPVAG